MARAFLEERQLSSALPHCPLEHYAETLHWAGSNYNDRQEKTVYGAGIQATGIGCDLEA